MIERYSLPEMKAVWSDENRFQKWLDVEILACEAMAILGKIPAEAVEVIKERARFDVRRINEIEKVTRHDVIAFLTCVSEYVGEEAKYLHLGLTSSDVVDTALAVRMVEAGRLILDKLEKLYRVLLAQAQKYRHTLIIGRTHGIHAEPMTFGLKMLLWAAETERNIARMKNAIEEVSVGKLSGAVGTYSSIDPFVEEYVCSRLLLVPAKVATQVIQRDRHAAYMTTLAVIAASLEKFAVEIRNLQRTDLREAEEPFVPGQKGSSAMPHKRNPIVCERITGLSRLVRSNAAAALENVALWHERDISHSSVERVIIPDSTLALDYMLYRFAIVVEKMHVYPENMLRNLERTQGLVFSQRVLLALVDKGLTREEAYQIVQRNAMESWNSQEPLKDLLARDADVQQYLSRAELDEIFDYRYFTRRIDTIFARFGL
ncbi:adenylosuccinate lyase [Desulforudis sp. 1088]|uniref:adenylosuccinate lyase n=1 Tax=unclassified Candidatus Desulforudis TaxID=2635950 RepID=UPI00347EA63C